MEFYLHSSILLRDNVLNSTQGRVYLYLLRSVQCVGEKTFLVQTPIN